MLGTYKPKVLDLSWQKQTCALYLSPDVEEFVHYIFTASPTVPDLFHSVNAMKI